MTTIFVAVLIIAIAISVTLTLILINHLYRYDRNELLSAFNDAASQINFHASKQEVLRSRVIGLDDVNNKLLFLVATKNKHHKYLINLNEIKSFTVKKDYDVVNASHIKRIGADAFIDRISLQV